jgi:hypothetical protein
MPPEHAGKRTGNHHRTSSSSPCSSCCSSSSTSLKSSRSARNDSASVLAIAADQPTQGPINATEASPARAGLLTADCQRAAAAGGDQARGHSETGSLRVKWRWQRPVPPPSRHRPHSCRCHRRRPAHRCLGAELAAATLHALPGAQAPSRAAPQGCVVLVRLSRQPACPGAALDRWDGASDHLQVSLEAIASGWGLGQWRSPTAAAWLA